MSRQRAARRRGQYDDLAVLDYIDRHQQAHRGRSPSQRRIMEAAQLSVPSIAHRIVHRLVRGGLLTMDVPQRGWTAELAITSDGHDALRSWRAGREPATGRESGQPKRPKPPDRA